VDLKLKSRTVVTGASIGIGRVGDRRAAEAAYVAYPRNTGIT
jgi:short-subunit dehydrogenase